MLVDPTAVGAVATVVSTFVAVPQVWRALVDLPSVEDVAIGSTLLWLLSNGLWLVADAELHLPIFVVGGVVSLTLELILLVQQIRFRLLA